MIYDDKDACNVHSITMSTVLYAMLINKILKPYYYTFTLGIYKSSFPSNVKDHPVS